MKLSAVLFAVCVAVVGVLSGMIGGAISQSNPGFVFGQNPTPQQWNSYFSAKLDYPLASPLLLNLSGGTPYPANAPASLQIVGSAASGGGNNIFFDNYQSGGSSRAGLFFRNSGGTPLHPTALGSGQSIGFIGWRGNDGTGLLTPASGFMEALTTEAFTLTAHGTAMSFYTTPNGTTARRVVATLGQDGALTLPVGYGSGGGLVTVQAADSCGTGFRCLRVPN